MQQSYLLKNRRFIYTRSAGDSSELRAMLAEHGGNLIDLPTIVVAKKKLDSLSKTTLEQIQLFDWIILTSSNAVKYLFEHITELNPNFKFSDKIKFAVVGAQTGKALENYGYNYHYINSGITGVEFANELNQIIVSNQKALYPTGILTGKNMENVLQNRITRINIYETIMPASIDNTIIKQIIDDNYDMLIFTSPSGFENLSQLVSSYIDITKIRAICIGTTTQQAMQIKGVQPLAVATTADSIGIAESIIEYYKSNN